MTIPERVIDVSGNDQCAYTPGETDAAVKISCRYDAAAA